MTVVDEHREQERRDGRAAFEERRWADAYRHLGAAHPSLDAEERLRHAKSAYLLGREDDCIRLLEDAYHHLEAAGQPAWAARCAFWLCLVLIDRGELARAGGWVMRGQGLLDHHDLDVVERGYLALPAGVQQLYAGAGEEAERRFADILDMAERSRDTDLATLARLGRGQALILQGQLGDGLSLLDEAMIGVTAGEVSPVIAGIVYCAVIEACHATFDLRRAQEWTDALTRWCDEQPDLVPYRGQCQVHRVEILRLHGAWRDAMTEANRARRTLSRPPVQPAVGAAIYQEAELYRLRGQLQRADEAYAEASAHGHDPQPGLAWLRLAQGATAAAVAGLQRALDEAAERVNRPRLLGAFVEVALAAGHRGAAREAADELAGIAAQHDAPMLQALGAQATAAVQLADGDAMSALREARRAWRIWHEFGAPYEAARTRVLVGRSCQALGADDGARQELDAARRAFRQLGARSDLAALESDDRARARAPTGGLTPREVEVLRLVAEGRTNRSIAQELVLSEKTVARHLSNIFTKLGVSSRAAATAWAYEHELR